MKCINGFLWASLKSELNKCFSEWLLLKEHFLVLQLASWLVIIVILCFMVPLSVIVCLWFLLLGYVVRNVTLCVTHRPPGGTCPLFTYSCQNIPLLVAKSSVTKVLSQVQSTKCYKSKQNKLIR